MRSIIYTAVLVFAAALSPACKKQEKKAEEAATPPPAEAPAPAPATDAAPAAPATPPAPDMANKMKNCPSAVAGAKTAVQQTKTAVVLMITASDKAAIADVQARAKKLSTLDASADAEVKHTGEGTGGGALGKCPVVMTDVTIKVESQKKGAKITLTPKDASKLADLAKVAQDRAAAVPTASGDGSGTGSGTGMGGGDGSGTGSGTGTGGGDGSGGGKKSGGKKGGEEGGASK
jgi:hypothetical protein